MSKNLAEIILIAEERRPESLSELSNADLNILLGILNRKRVPMTEQDEFSSFYLQVIHLVRNV